MAAQLFYLPFRPAINMNGFPIPDARLYFYYAGGLTLAPIYSDSALSVPLENPVSADAAGRWPNIYYDTTILYRVVVKDANGVTIPGHDVDPYVPLPDVATNSSDFVSPEQFGAATEYDPAVNDRPFILLAQAVSEVRQVPLKFMREEYAIHMPVTGNMFTYSNGGFEILGTAPRTKLVRFGPNGESDPTSFVSTVVTGGGFGPASGIDTGETITRSVIRNVTIDGGRTDCYLGTATNWNIYDKGFRMQDQAFEKLIFDNVEICNFGGELTFVNGTPGGDCEWHLTDCHFHSSAANTFNAAGMVRVFDTNGRYGNAYSTENLGGPGSVLNGTEFYDTETCYFAGGPWPSYETFYGYAKRSNTATPPWLQLNNVQFNNCENVAIGNWVRGTIYATDSSFFTADTGKVENIDLTINNCIDRKNNILPFYVYGPATDTTEYGNGMPTGTYIKPPANSRIHLILTESDYARANNYKWGRPFAWLGLVDSSFRVIIEGRARQAPIDVSGGSVLSMPNIEFRDFDTDASFGDGLNWKGVECATGSVTKYAIAPLISLTQTGGPGTSTISVPKNFATVGAYTPTYRVGQIIRFIHKGGAGVTFTFPASDTTNFALSSDRSLTAPEQWADFRMTRTGKWVLHSVGTIL